MADLTKDAEALVSKMTIEEVASQLKYDAEAIDRLGIPAYNWWSEALHGVARAGTATVFPQAIGLAAMFDEEMLTKIAEVIATEARAKYNAQSAHGDRDIYKGLTMWSPNINIFRDQRWGRGHETYGEDPYLTGRLGVAFIKGLQGFENYPEDDVSGAADGEAGTAEGTEAAGRTLDTLKVAACAKHYAVHSGPESKRHHFNAKAGAKDMAETYLPAFEAAVKEGRVEAVMGAYNRTNDEPCCGSKTLIEKLLRGEWGFNGHFVSDCWAVRDFHENHRITNTPAQSAAMALSAGCDLNCGDTYLCILAALKEGLVTEEQMRKACVRLMKTRMKLGILDRSDAAAKSKTAKYDAISFLECDTREHNALSLEAARRSIVLLANDGTLPLREEDYKTIGVIGPTADLRSVLEGNYNGTASEYVTNLNGIRSEFGGRILYSQGAHLYLDATSALSKHDDLLAEAAATVENSDITILCVGLDATIEGEEGDTGNMFASGDKTSLNLPESQIRLAKCVMKTAKEHAKKVIVVLNAGSAIDLSFLTDDAAAIVDCWYSGGFGGRALAEVLFGKVNPSGRLPVTFYRDGEQPDFDDYSMKNRTYRYYRGEPLYPFGHGLSYTRFTYALSGKIADAPVAASGNETAGWADRKADYLAFQAPAVELRVEVKNAGDFDGEDAVLVFVNKCPEEKCKNGLCDSTAIAALDPENQPAWSLCAFKRAALKAGSTETVNIPVSAWSLTTVLENGERAFLPGRYIFKVGNQSVEIVL
ncbi:MAG: glycoside hydrolase family 3 C-terminal domain-containing protein [Lachnospiraceae bacterium]|nr:glycoside hydrolase family 3 C-terminal domain-containing protein [Lachnospiraceae bacterium]